MADAFQGRTGTVAFARRNARVLAFGFLHAFLSAPGQTISIGLFIGSFSAAFGLGAAEIGGLYLVATVASAATLLAVGHLIDRVDLKTYSSLSIAGLALACGLTAAAWHPLALLAGLYALRLTGQGLMVHIEATATARTFTADRGRALGITALGLPVSDAVVPAIVVAAIAALGWRWTYGAIGLLLLVAALPLARRLAPPVRARDPATPPSAHPRLSTGLFLLAGSRYVWAALPALAIVPFFATAIAFNVTTIASARGWSHELVAASFPAMALANVGALFLSGWLIDRYSARLIFLGHGLPIALGLALLALVEDAWALPVALMLVGISGAIAKTTGTAIWAELFGIANLGAMRSFATMYMVLASALAPLSFGVLVDLGWSISAVLTSFAIAGLVASVPVATFEIMRKRPV